MTWTRRRALSTGIGMLAGFGVGCASSATSGQRHRNAERPDFAAAFLTDPHVYPEKRAALGFERAVQHALAQKRAPELVITGGDLAFDILGTGRQAADRQYDLFDSALSAVKVPIHHTLGNHDCLGVYEDSGMSPGDPLYGKRYFLERFGLERTYESFDHENWHFVILDTIDLVDRGYRGGVDAEQLAWLADDLASTEKPTVVVGHVPLFSNFIEWRRGTSEGIPAGVSVVNSHEVAEVLLGHRVRLVLGGHLHIVERFEYKGIEFANLGAVSGNWWKGQRDGFEEGYAVLEFRGDQVSWRYVDYGWEVAEADAA